MLKSKVTIITELLKKGFQADNLGEANQHFRKAFILNKESEKKDKQLIEKSKNVGIALLQSVPKFENFTAEELNNLYPNRNLNLEVLSPSTIAVKQLKRELFIE